MNYDRIVIVLLVSGYVPWAMLWRTHVHPSSNLLFGMLTIPKTRLVAALVLFAAIGCGSIGTAPTAPDNGPTVIQLDLHTVGKDSVKLTWTVPDSSTPVAVRIYRDNVVLQDVTSPSFLDTHIVASQAYQYKVAGLNKDNVEIAHSAAITFTETSKR